jgi:Zn-finger nucleic acid-binding protein
MALKCPACKGPLREKGAGPLVVDTCYGGCGGIWFDAQELNRVSDRAAASLHTVWRDSQRPVTLTEPRPCPRCDQQILERGWFSQAIRVEIDRCPRCGGMWLDEGEFSRIRDELGRSPAPPPRWASAMAEAAASIRSARP